MQADLLEHMELGCQVPGRLLAHGNIQEAAARLASAICQIKASAMLHANARSMQEKLQREDGIAVAAAVLQLSAAVQRLSAPRPCVQPTREEAAAHGFLHHESSGDQVRRLCLGYCKRGHSIVTGSHKCIMRARGDTVHNAVQHEM